MINFLNSIALTSCLILSATTIIVTDSAIASPKVRCLIRGGRWSKKETLVVFDQRNKAIYVTSSKKRRKLEKRGAKQGCKNFSNVFQ
tara:strand:- start:524 stop:784 length:261 start_codon:yes stop_codon:yes gene_type:complete